MFELVQLLGRVAGDRIKGCLMISVPDVDPAGALGRLAGFRAEFHRCLSARGDALFELVDAVLCADTPVRSLAELSLSGAHRRGHGAMYAALNRGRIDVDRLRTVLSAVPVPRAADGRIVLAVDVTCWLRPEAHTSPQRVLCHAYGRTKDTHIGVPGWPYSVVVALESGRHSWTAPLDARRLAPGDDAATVTAAQLRDVVERLVAAGQWQPGDPDLWIVADAGYDGPRLALLLADLPVQKKLGLPWQSRGQGGVLATSRNRHRRRMPPLASGACRESIPGRIDLGSAACPAAAGVTR